MPSSKYRFLEQDACDHKIVDATDGDVIGEATEEQAVAFKKLELKKPKDSGDLLAAIGGMIILQFILFAWLAVATPAAPRPRAKPQTGQAQRKIEVLLVPENDLSKTVADYVAARLNSGMRYSATESMPVAEDAGAFVFLAIVCKPLKFADVSGVVCHQDQEYYPLRHSSLSTPLVGNLLTGPTTVVLGEVIFKEFVAATQDDALAQAEGTVIEGIDGACMHDIACPIKHR
jgi:hypothetical protein